MVTISLIKPEAKASTFSNKTLGIQSSLKPYVAWALLKAWGCWLMADERILTSH